MTTFSSPTATWVSWKCGAACSFNPGTKFSICFSLYANWTLETLVSFFSSRIWTAFLSSGFEWVDSSPSKSFSTTWLTLIAFFSGWMSSAVAVTVSVVRSGPSFTPVCTCVTWTVRCSSDTDRAVWRSLWIFSSGASLYETWTSATLVSVFWSSTGLAFFISGFIDAESSDSVTPSTTWWTLMAFFLGWMSSALAVNGSVVESRLSDIPVSTWITSTFRCSSVTARADWTSPARKSSSGASL